ncbi:hypothetical protein [Pseudonocardia sp. NPDC049154]|uniref:hypothetical protein n=1 Tax=Pseudonocardia sp. NPDC049154 TaxID=3155501 RepID=UPI0033EE83E7
MSESPAVERARSDTGAGTSFVLDGNLGLPVHEPGWAAVLARLGITAESSSDLVAIDREVAAHRADLAFIPAADHHRFRAARTTRGWPWRPRRGPGCPCSAACSSSPRTTRPGRSTTSSAPRWGT